MHTMTEVKKDDTRNLLADIELFAGLTPAQLDWVAQRAHRRVFEAGRNVMTIEQPGEAVYIILHGTVKIHVEQGERDVILSILGSGDLLGEMSLIDSVGRSASDWIIWSESLTRAERIARQLLAFAERYGQDGDGVLKIRITLTQSDIADLVG